MQFCLNYAIFDELCEKLGLEVNYAKSQHCRISEAVWKVSPRKSPAKARMGVCGHFKRLVHNLIVFKNDEFYDRAKAWLTTQNSRRDILKGCQRLKWQQQNVKVDPTAWKNCQSR